MLGRLIGIARAAVKRGPMEELSAARITVEAGIEGDRRGVKPGRQVTVLFREGWEDACREAGSLVPLPWTTRRASLYVEGVEPPRRIGARLQVGEVVLEVTDETKPCALMDQAFLGLRAAMRPEWRGGVCCNVVHGGDLRLGAAVATAEPASA